METNIAQISDLFSYPENLANHTCTKLALILEKLHLPLFSCFFLVTKYLFSKKSLKINNVFVHKKFLF